MMYGDETLQFFLFWLFAIVVLFGVWLVFAFVFRVSEFAVSTFSKDDLCTPHTWRLHPCKKDSFPAVEQFVQSQLETVPNSFQRHMEKLGLLERVL